MVSDACNTLFMLHSLLVFKTDDVIISGYHVLLYTVTPTSKTAAETVADVMSVRAVVYGWADNKYLLNLES